MSTESPSPFLTGEELFTLTGYRRPKLQIEQLRRMGVPHWVNALDRPIVRRDFGSTRETPTAAELGAVE